MRSIILLFPFCSGVFLEATPKPTHAPPIWHASNPSSFAYHDLQSNYWDLYPRGDAVAIESIAPLEDGVGFHLKLVSEDPDISGFVYSINGGEEIMSRNGSVQVTFEDGHTLKNYFTERRELEIAGLRKDGTRSRTYHLATQFYPSERYQAAGRIQDGHGRIHIRESDLNFARSRPDDFILETPTEADITFATETWGHLLNPSQSPYEQARALATALVHELTPHRGTPSDVMDTLDPFDQYRRLIAGEDACWCANIATVFAHANNAFGIPTRFIIMRHQLFPPPAPGKDGYEILMATGHTTNEVFDRQQGQWIWMDLTYNIWGAYLGEEGPLNMLELHSALNEPARFRQLEADLYDPETDTLSRIRVAEHPVRIRLRNAFKQDQLFRYMRRPDTGTQVTSARR